MLVDRYKALLDKNQPTEDPVARVTQRDAIVRSALQVAAICGLEEGLRASRLDEEGRGSLDILCRHADSLLDTPKSDGGYGEILRAVSRSQIHQTQPSSVAL